MSDRIIDFARHSGEDIGPKRAQATPKMTYERAVEYHEKFAWRALPTKSDQARAACIREVERLRLANSELAREALSFEGEARESSGKLVRFYAALPGIIVCQEGDPTVCTHEPPGYWAPCCGVRRRCVEAGLLPTIDKAAGKGDET